MFLDSLLPSLPGIALTVAILLGGLWAFRRSSVKQLGELQQSVIATYKAENDAQELKIKSLEKKVARLESVISTLQITFKKRRGLLIEIDEDVITLVDQRTGAEHTVKINVSDQHEAIKLDKEQLS